MATIQKRKSHGQYYWYIVESRRVNGKPRPITLEYLGKPYDLYLRLKGQKPVKLKSYSHGDTAALINIANELNIINSINKYIPLGKNGKKPIRDNLTVGASFLLGAIGRVCQPTSKLGWYNWCKTTSLEYCLRTSFRNLDSQHFWDQMDFLPVENIPKIEEEIVKKMIQMYEIKLDCLFYDTTNFFTFIASQNKRCDIPKRGRNKQKRFDLRQIGLALLVTRKDQFPLFHNTYNGNKNDITSFQEVFKNFMTRLKGITTELTDITLVFDKGNNSKDNFKLIDDERKFHYVGGLVSSHFQELIKEANKNFSEITINGEKIPVYQIKKNIWGEERTCVITISKQLKEGQIQGIQQHLEKKYKVLSEFKKQLENPKRKKTFKKKEIETKLKKIIKGQFVENILKYEFIKLSNKTISFIYFLDNDAFDTLKQEVLGRKILVTNRHDWSCEEILLAYRGQSNVERAFKNMKNPYHLAVRPQYHWTDQKIEAHIFMCIIGYLLAIAAYSKVRQKVNYKHSIDNFMNDLCSIRLGSMIENKNGTKGSLKVKYQLEKIDPELEDTAQILGISNENLKTNLPGFVVYN